MAYNTNNPVGSTDPRDLYDNAGNLDKFVNGDAPFYPDRLGQQRKSWSGIEADAENAFQGWGEQFQAFLLASGYEAPVSYAAGVTLQRVTQTFVRDNIQYRIKDPILLPYTLTGNWASESGNFVSMGDSSLRQDLMLGESQIVSPGAVSYSSNGSTASLKVSLDAIFKNGLHPSMFGFAPGDDIAPLLNSVQYPFDLRGDSYTLSAGVSRTASLFNGTLSYGGAAPGTFLGGIVVFTGPVGMDARRLMVVYTGSSPLVRGICAHSGAHKLNLRGAYTENTTDQGIRVQGCDDVDLDRSGAYNCMRDAIGSTDNDKAYGAIAVFGASAPSNRASMRYLYIRTQSTGLSVMSGDDHIIECCDIRTIDPITASPVSMGIYCGSKIRNLTIASNYVEGFANEGIDVHNTGGSATAGIRGIYIGSNTCLNNSYVGISVVADVATPIEDATIEKNIVGGDSAGRTFGYTGGVVCEYVNSVFCRGNKATLTSATSAAQSYAYQFSNCNNVHTSANMGVGPWNRMMFAVGYNYWSIDGFNGSDIASGQDGILIVQNTASAVHAFNGIRLKESSPGSGYVIRQAASSLTLSNFHMNGCSFEGRVNITNFSSGVVSGNTFTSFSGTLACSGTGFIGFNSGFLNQINATSVGAITGAIPVSCGGTIKYIGLHATAS